MEPDLEDFQLIDAALCFGSTLHWNRYPSAQRDANAYLYLPLLKEITSGLFNRTASLESGLTSILSCSQ
ncbi:MAG: hypothetical protein AAGF57_16550 [Pseudomonadota bacterium]